MKYLFVIFVFSLFSLQIFAAENPLSKPNTTIEVDPNKKTDPEKIKKIDSTNSELEQIQIKQSKEINKQSITNIPPHVQNTNKPSPQTEASKKVTSSESVSSDESVLTFNFIYYLLKYKFSEVIE